MVASTTFFSGLSNTQQKTLAIVPKFTWASCIVGSLYVMYKTLRRSPSLPGLADSRSFTNLLLGLCFADVVAATGFFLSTWPIPMDNIYSDYFWGERGNQTTCNFQGKNTHYFKLEFHNNIIL